MRFALSTVEKCEMICGGCFWVLASFPRPGETLRCFVVHTPKSPLSLSERINSRLSVIWDGAPVRFLRIGSRVW